MATGARFRSDLFEGAKTVTPLLPAPASIGLITGLAAASIGLGLAQAVAMSVALFSPVVMLTAIHMLDIGAPLVVVVFASLVVAVRFAILSLSLSPYLDRVSTAWKWFLAYFLLTPTYVLSIERFDADPETDRVAYYLGLSLPGWVVLQAAFVLGFQFGALVPAAWQLGFVIPLAFVALLMQFLSARAGRVAALAAGVLAVVGDGLPLGVGLILAIVGGTVAGVVVQRREGA